jgi:hypothetical protein
MCRKSNQQGDNSMKTLVTLSFAAMLLSSTAVLAQSQQAFDALDNDGDDQLSYSDLLGQWPDLTQQQFDAADIDNNDFLDITQFESLQSNVSAGASTEVAAVGVVTPKIDAPLFESLDTDGNGKISIDDLGTLGVDQAQFDAADIDNDDFLDATQYETLKSKLGVPETMVTESVGVASSDLPMFEDVDSNGDGMIAFTDLQSLLPNVTQDQFDAADIDDDNFLDRTQYEGLEM